MEQNIDDLIKHGDREPRLEYIAFNDDTINTTILGRSYRRKPSAARILPLLPPCRNQMLPVSPLAHQYEEVLSHLLGPPASESLKVFDTTQKAMVFFAMPQKLSTCRICSTLGEKGDNKNLYEDHYGNFPTHCPRWSEVTIEERLDIIREAEFCNQCLDPKVVFKNSKMRLWVLVKASKEIIVA